MQLLSRWYRRRFFLSSASGFGKRKRAEGAVAAAVATAVHTQKAAPRQKRRKKHKILFVCHGNICRSPMAEFLFKDMVKKAGRENEFEIASCAVSEEEIYRGIGNPVYPPVKALLSSLGISCEGNRARLLTAKDGEYYDFLLCMDESNVRGAKRIVGEENGEKCKKLLSFAGEIGDVADPWYTRDFHAAKEDIERGLNGLLESL